MSSTVFVQKRFSYQDGFRTKNGCRTKNKIGRKPVLYEIRSLYENRFGTNLVLNPSILDSSSLISYE